MADERTRLPARRTRRRASRAGLVPYALDLQRLQFESFLRQQPKLDALRRADEQNLRRRIAPLKFPRHRQAGEQMPARSPAGENHPHLEPPA